MIITIIIYLIGCIIAYFLLDYQIKHNEFYAQKLSRAFCIGSWAIVIVVLSTFYITK